MDDFLFSGKKHDLKLFHKAVAAEFKIKNEIVGLDAGETEEIQVLGRCIGRTAQGYEYEGDRKHARVLLKGWEMTESRTVSSPGAAAEKADVHGKAGEEKELDTKQATIYRRATARLNYFGP